ncbi:hypothetical protein JW905_18845 [bacterium]|nr:hypothetical protein [candidate division CSSED10-310 bacterium]
MSAGNNATGPAGESGDELLAVLLVMFVPEPLSLLPFLRPDESIRLANWLESNKSIDANTLHHLLAANVTMAPVPPGRIPGSALESCIEWLSRERSTVVKAALKLLPMEQAESILARLPDELKTMCRKCGVKEEEGLDHHIRTVIRSYLCAHVSVGDRGERRPEAANSLHRINHEGDRG